jgi:hypothetical protein
MARTPVESALIAAGLLLVASGAQAQPPAREAAATPWLAAAPKKDKGSDSDSADNGKDAEKTEDEKDEKAAAKPAEGESDIDKKDRAAKEESAEDSSDPTYEERHKTYRFIGVRARGVVIPSFMFGLFGAKGGETVFSPQVGAEFGIRRNDFEYDLFLTYARYALGDTTFKASGDPENAWEIVSAKLNTLTIGGDFLWSHKFNNKVQFVYGIGLGLSVVFGSLNRTQAYKAPDGSYQKCTGVGNPTTVTDPKGDAYCGNDNDHYNGYKEASWANGGQKPLILPWISPFLVGVRWKPHKNVAMRAEIGLALPGPFFFGLSGQYGL